MSGSTQQGGDASGMTTATYWTAIRKRWPILVAVTLVLTAAAAAFSLRASPVYTASASVFFSTPYGTTAGDLSQGSLFTQGQMQSYAELATTATVLDPVIQQLGLDTTAGDLAGSVSTQVTPQTVILQVQASGPSAKEAADTANAVAKQLGVVARDLSPRNAKDRPTVEAATVGAAVPPSAPSGPSKKRNIAAGLLAGLFLGFLAAVLRDRLDTRVHAVSDVAAVTYAPVLAEVPRSKPLADGGLVIRDDPRSPAAEQFRRLRTNVHFLGVGERTVSLVVTSAVPGEGKSLTAVNLALACSEAGDRVLVIDGDLRKPSVARRFGLEGAAGLTTILTGDAEFGDVVQTAVHDNLHVLAAGQVPPNPSELLGSWMMAKLMEDVSSAYDVIIFDSPPLLPVVDAAVLAQRTTGAVIVVQVERVKRDQLSGAVKSLNQVQAPLLGLVLTGTAVPTMSAYAR